MIPMTSTTVTLQREPEVRTGRVDAVSNVQDDAAVLVQVKKPVPSATFWASGNNVPSEGEIWGCFTFMDSPRGRKLDPGRSGSLNGAFCHHKGEAWCVMEGISMTS